MSNVLVENALDLAIVLIAWCGVAALMLLLIMMAKDIFK